MSGANALSDVSSVLVMPLVRQFAQRMGQRRIADELNGMGIYQANGKPWNQTAMARYMQKNEIQPAWALTIFPPEHYEKRRTDEQG